MAYTAKDATAKKHLRQDSSSSGYSILDSEFSSVDASTLMSHVTEYEGTGSGKQRSSTQAALNESNNRSALSTMSSVAPLKIQKAARWINAQLSSPQRSRRPSTDSGNITYSEKRHSQVPSLLAAREPGVTQTPRTPQQEWPVEPVTPTTIHSLQDGVALRVADGVRISSLSSSPRLSLLQPVKVESTQSHEQMRKRHNCIRELYNTEYLFAQDMAVIVRLYMCASADIGLSVRQIDTLFANVPQILDISLSLVAILETSIPTQILQGDGTITSYDVTADQDVRVGRAMCLALNGQLYEAYEDYIHHSQQQLELYYELTKHFRRHPQMTVEQCNDKVSNVNPKQVSAWLMHCGERAAKFTTAWSLDSLLIKPVQRLGKYPLFLQTLLECTSEEHADFADIERALRRSKHYLDCVNARLGQKVS